MVYTEAKCHLINHSIGILVGLETQASWGTWLGTENIEMKISGDIPGKEHVIARYKQGGHFVVPTFRAAKGEKFEVKTPEKGTTEHKSKNYFISTDNVKNDYDKKLATFQKIDDQLAKLANSRTRAEDGLKQTKVGP